MHCKRGPRLPLRPRPIAALRPAHGGAQVVVETFRGLRGPLGFRHGPQPTVDQMGHRSGRHGGFAACNNRFGSVCGRPEVRAEGRTVARLPATPFPGPCPRPRNLHGVPGDSSDLVAPGGRSPDGRRGLGWPPENLPAHRRPSGRPGRRARCLMPDRRGQEDVRVARRGPRSPGSRTFESCCGCAVQHVADTPPAGGPRDGEGGPGRCDRGEQQRPHCKMPLIPAGMPGWSRGGGPVPL